MSKGTVWDILPLMILFFILSIVIFLSFYIMNLLNTQISPQVNNDADAILNRGVTTLANFNNLFVIIVIGISLSPVVGAFYIDAHPVFFLASLILLAVLIWISAIFSNVFYTIVSESTFSGIVNTFPLMITVMRNYPLFIMVLGFTIIIVVYSKSRTREGA